MGWLFSTPRNTDDPRQLQIAIHELGHAWAWRDSGLIVKGVEHSGDDGVCHVRYYPNNPEQIVAFAIGLWAGFEAEDRWLKANKLGRAKRGHSSHDIREFRQANRELGKRGISEGKARSHARKLVSRHWSRIERSAPELVRRGRLHV